MNKIWLVIQREYLTRVRKKSFIIMSILGPLLFGGFFAGVTWMSTIEDTEVRTIAVVDSSRLFINQLPETKNLKFVYPKNTSIETLKQTFPYTEYYALLYIPHIITYSANTVQLYCDKQPGITVKMHIANAIEKRLKDEKLRSYNITNLDEILKSVEAHVEIQSIKLLGDGREKESNAELATGMAYMGGLLIYMFIFMFGSQVMRGVMEEKNNRIVEIIVSSLKPFQLMMGKIIGIAFVGLTQFLIWVALTIGIVNTVQQKLIPDASAITQTHDHKPVSILETTPKQVNNPTEIEPVFNERYSELQGILNAIYKINWPLILLTFLFYFLGGYLFYGSLFAAIGSMAGAETDTQQFTLPITIPLIFALFVMISALQNPESSLAFWCSFIPFTSPIVMMARIPFGVPDYEIAISMITLIISFIASTWLAGKVYRTAILMYGKKINYREVLKWLKHKA